MALKTADQKTPHMWTRTRSLISRELRRRVNPWPRETPNKYHDRIQWSSWSRPKYLTITKRKCACRTPTQVPSTLTAAMRWVDCPRLRSIRRVRAREMTMRFSIAFWTWNRRPCLMATTHVNHNRQPRSTTTTTSTSAASPHLTRPNQTAINTSRTGLNRWIIFIIWKLFYANLGNMLNVSSTCEFFFFDFKYKLQITLTLTELIDCKLIECMHIIPSNIGFEIV